MNFTIFLVFLSGFLTQMFVMLSKPIRRTDFINIFGIFFVSFFIITVIAKLFTTTDIKHDQYLSTYVFFFFVIYGFIFAKYFSARLIQPINARTLLIVNLLICVVVFEKVPLSLPWFWVFFTITGYVVVNAVTNIDFHFRTKLFLYTWYVILLLISSLYVYSMGDLPKIFSSTVSPITHFNVFITGGVLLYIIVQLTLLLQFFEYRRGGETKRSAQWRLKQHKKLMASGYVRHKGDVVGNIVVFVIVVIFLYVNSIQPYIDLRTAILFTLALIPFVHNRMKDMATVKP